MEAISERLMTQRERIARAAARSGREASDVALIGVAKGVSIPVLREAVAAGLVDLGANYVQEWRDAAAALGREVRWHFIGRLQSKKIPELTNRCATIQTVSSAPAVAAIAQRAVPEQAILVQVNVGGEAQKSGCEPEEAEAVVLAAAAEPRVRIRGLMTIPPHTEDPEGARPHYRALRALRDRIRDRLWEVSPARAEEFRELSMGMSHDLEVGVEEGATMVRVGTALFGTRRKA